MNKLGVIGNIISRQMWPILKKISGVQNPHFKLLSQAVTSIITMMNSFNKPEAAIFLMHAVLSEGFPFSVEMTHFIL